MSRVWENSSPKTEQLPLVFADESNYYRFIKILQVLAKVFKNKKITETTRKNIIQVLMNPIFPPERNTDAMNLFLSSIGKIADFQFSDENFKKLAQSSRVLELESNYNEEVKLRKEAEEALARKKEELEMMEQNYEAELRFSRETEIILSIQRERIKKVTLRLETVEKERDDMRLKAGLFESKYKAELILRLSKIALDKERKELEAVKQERDNALKTAQELMEKRQPPSSFFCPITQEVMKDPHFAADGFTYEAEAIKKWLSTGHRTSPMTNLKLPHLILVPNRALRSAIQELV